MQQLQNVVNFAEAMPAEDLIRRLSPQVQEWLTIKGADKALSLLTSIASSSDADLRPLFNDERLFNTVFNQIDWCQSIGRRMATEAAAAAPRFMKAYLGAVRSSH